MSSAKPDNCDSPTMSHGLLPVDTALERIRTAMQPIRGYERLALRESLGRICAQDVTSPINVPGYINSAMDGYALNATNLPAEGEENRLEVIGTAFAGKPYEGELEPGQAVRIMTGAAVPTGADTVVMQEHVLREGDSITLTRPGRLGDNVRQIGEDLKVGQVVVAQGKKINPAELGLLASLGIGEISVYRRLRVAFFSTGDELCSIGEALGPGQIYDSNRYALHGLLHRLGAEIIDMGVIRDRREAIEEAFHTAADVADVVITSGGVSVGEADFVTETLTRLGEVDFWKIAMKPGKPLAFGRLGSAWFFGLPGNPVSTMATFYQIVQPSLRHLMGQIDVLSPKLMVPTVDRLKKSPGRQDFQRGLLRYDATGRLVVHSTGAQGSHILRSMSEANCFIILPAEAGDIEANTLVQVQPFDGLI